MGELEWALGRVIAAERKRVGVTQEELAYRAKLHPTYISQLERGLKSPTLRALAPIAAVLAVPPSELLKKAEAAKDESR
jgi:transcriptional regulator with XRE-family HTH domain